MGVLSIREFNSNVSKAIAAVEAGEDIVLTRNGLRIARITREGLDESKTRRETDLKRLRQLMSEGIDLGGAATYDERTSR